MKWNYAFAFLFAVSLVVATVNPSFAQEDAEAAHAQIYIVEITNITQGQSFSPMVVATHLPGVRIFELAEPARPALVVLAENGNPVPLATALSGLPKVDDVRATNELLKPGESVRLRLRARTPMSRVSVVGMMLPTNDAFLALNGASGPRRRGVITHFAPAFDAGSELNDEQCGSIPGPHCGGNGGLDENGVIHIHNGIHGTGELSPSRRDWNNPVARVRIHGEPVPGTVEEPTP